MVESIMLFGCGFLAASLLAMMLFSAVHRRAVRLTRLHLQDTVPTSLIEIQAGSDHLRADFAISICRLEKSVEQLRIKAAGQLSEIGRQRQTINRLTAELERRTSAVDKLVHKVESLTGKIAEVERERDRIAMEVISLECALSAKEVELVRSAIEQRPAIDIHNARQRFGESILPIAVTNTDLQDALTKRELLLSRCDDEMNTLVPKP
jgi:septal ring factor EnvC (AmiA/AmiB activator)